MVRQRFLSARSICLSLAAVMITLSLGAAPASSAKKPVLILSGYPAPDTPLYEFAFRRQHAKVEVVDATWVPAKDYAKYGVVVLSGNIGRAGIKPSAYSADDVKALQAFLQEGGTLILTGGSFDIFRSPAGGPMLESIIGKGNDTKDKEIKLLQPQHRWVTQLAEFKDLSWFFDGGALVPVASAQRIIGTENGRSAILFEQPVGRGKVIYVGWSFAKFIPGGRNLNSTIEDEQRYEAQYHVLSNIASELYPASESR